MLPPLPWTAAQTLAVATAMLLIGVFASFARFQFLSLVVLFAVLGAFSAIVLNNLWAVLMPALIIVGGVLANAATHHAGEEDVWKQDEFDVQ